MEYSKRARHLAETLPYLALLVLLLAAPFETLVPALELFDLDLTNVELAGGAALGLWLLCRAVRRSRLQPLTPLLRSALLLLGVLLLSALQAHHPGEALRFCGRFAAGLMIFLLVVNEAGTQRRQTGLMLAMLCAGTAAAVLGQLEALQVSSVVDWLGRFKTDTALVGGELRVSSTLQYPTIASMYWEITFGLGLGLFLRARNRAPVLLAAGALLITAQAILLTQTRAGVAILLMQLAGAGMLWWLRRGWDRRLRAFLLLAAAVLGLLAYRLAADPYLQLRFASGGPGEWYMAGLQVPDRLALAPGEVRQVPVVLTNSGRVPWSSRGDHPFYLSYHWVHPEMDAALVFDGVRSPLPGVVRPGATVEMLATVLAPPRPGRYRLGWDMVQEEVLWFSTEDFELVYSDVLVEGEPLPGTLRPVPLPRRRIRLGRTELWVTALRVLWANPLLGAGPDNFRLVYGSFLDLREWDPRLHTNNMYLEFFASAGLPGGLLFLYLSLCVLRLFRRLWPVAEEAEFPLFVGIAAAAAAIAVHGMIDYFLIFTPTYVAIWATWAAASALLAGRDRP